MNATTTCVVLSLAALLIGCGPSDVGTDDDGASAHLDAPGGAGDRDAARDGSDAVPAATIDVLPLCQPYVRTIRFQDGQRYVYTARWAIIDAVGPGDDFTIEHCNAVTTQTPSGDCPPGATCTGSTAPVGSSCQIEHRVGSFIEGKLAVGCGGSVEQYNASGALTNRSMTTYQVIRVMH